MPPAAQMKLAQLLRARTHVTAGGHGGSPKELVGLTAALADHVLGAAAAAASVDAATRGGTAS